MANTLKAEMRMRERAVWYREIAAEVEKEGGDIVANNYRRKAEGVEEALKILLMSQ